MEHAARLTAHDALVQLAAGAARAFVIDERAVVEVLLAGGHVEAVEDALASLGGEQRAHLVPRQGAAQGDRRGAEPAVPALLHLEERKVDGARALFLQLVVIEPGALAQHDLGHGVGEIGLLPRPRVGLDDRRLASGARDEEIAGLRGGRLSRRGGDEQEMDRLLHHRAGGQMDEGAVLDEGGVERGERVPLVARMAAQLTPHQLRPIGERGRQAADVGAARGFSQRGELRPVAAVDEDELDRAVSQRPAANLGQRPPRGWLESKLGERSQARVLPVFVLRGGQTELVEPGEGGLAQRLDRPIPERGETVVEAAHEVRHRAASRRPSSCA